MQSFPDIRVFAESVNDFIEKTTNRIVESWNLFSHEFDSASDDVKEVPSQIHEAVEDEFHKTLNSTKDDLSGNMENFIENQKDISRQKAIESLTKKNENKSQYDRKNEEYSEK